MDGKRYYERNDGRDGAVGVTHVQDVIASEEESQVRASWLERDKELARRERELMQRDRIYEKGK